MKIKIIILNLILATTIFSLNCKKQEVSQSGNALKWYVFNEGLKVAKNENKIVIVDFYAAWCKWCKVMEEEIFSDSEMLARLKKDFICVRLYMDSPSTGIINYKGNQYSNQQFSMIMRVTGLPTLLFLNFDEEIITVIPGYTQKPVFSSILDYILDYKLLNCSKKNVNFNDFIEKKEKCNG